MNTFLSEEQRQADEVTKRLVGLIDFDVETLRRADLGPQSFSEAILVFERCFRLVDRLRGIDFISVPSPILNDLNQRLDGIHRRIDSIRTFNGSSAANRDALARNWADQYPNEFSCIAQVLAVTPLKIPDFRESEKMIAESTRLIADAEKRFQAFEGDTKAQVKSVLEAARTASLGSGVAAHAKCFEEEAKANARVAVIWLAVFVVMAAVTAAFGFYLADHYSASPPTAGGNVGARDSVPVEMPLARAIQVAVARLFIFSVLYFATVWCGRMFKAHKHNELVNRHRQHSLRTFEAFLAATSDDATRNAVLLQTTTAIFAQTNTGFISGDSDSPPQPHVIEMVKSFNSK
jgi:hypothetical protein